MKKRKRGSTIIIVTFSLLTIMTIAVAMVSLINTDYRRRIEESNSVKNMYSASSGLDAVYNVITKDCSSAVLYGKARVYSEYNGNIDTKDGEINEKFKDYFMEFLGGAESDIYDKSGNIIEIPADNAISINKNTLIYSIQQLSYKSMEKFPSAVNDDDKIKAFADKDNTDGTSFYKYKYINGLEDVINNESNKKFDILISKYEYDKKTKKIIISVESSFRMDSPVKLDSKKTVQTKYVIEAPEYTDAIGNTDLYRDIPEYQVQSGLYVNGNVDVNNGYLEVTGDMWVKGVDNSNIAKGLDYKYAKYDNGIYVDRGKVTVRGDVSTNETINLSTKNLNDRTSMEVVDGNVYAKNVYIGPQRDLSAKEESMQNIEKNDIFNFYLHSTGSEVTKANPHPDYLRSNLILNNDLTVDSGGAYVLCNNYYGISGYKEDENSGISKNSAAQNSSSIIVNTINPKYEINVSHDAYIAGLSYIDTKGETFYQTGESISVIKNYKAYTKESEEGDILKEYQTQNGESISLLDKNKDGESYDNFDKSKAFSSYYASGRTPYGNKIFVGGTVHSLGAYVKNYMSSDKVSLADGGHAEAGYNWNLDNQITMDRVLNAKRETFGKSVYGIGEDYTGRSDNWYDGILNGEEAKSLSDVVDFDVFNYDKFVNINNGDPSSNTYKSEGYAIFGDNDHTIKVESNSLGVAEIRIYNDDNGSYVVVGQYAVEDKYRDGIKAMIITSGDLIVNTPINIYGCVIVGGNVEVNNCQIPTTGFKIEKDQDIINDIIAQNYEEFIPGFLGRVINTTTNIRYGESTDINKSDSVKSWFDAEKNIKTGLWKMKKEATSVLEN